MAPMKQSSSNYSNYGEDASGLRKANVLTSCYIADHSAAGLKAIHYCTTGAAGAECPPLAAITSTNQLALKAKPAKNGHGRLSGRNDTARRRGGAALRIREECVRFFCETLRALFLVERNGDSTRSGLTGALTTTTNNNNNTTDISNNNVRFNAYGQLTPPPDTGSYFPSTDCSEVGAHHAAAWLEIWDYAGGASFRAFLSASTTDPDEKALFVFFDAASLGRDLKQALVALIELAEGPLGCAHMVICVDRMIPEDEALPLTKGLQWAGFSLTTLDYWTGGVDATSGRWVFMGMEL